jgi:phage terminase large subunit-like protein
VGITLDSLIKYSNDVISGEILSCKKHKWACQRFLSDLERSRANTPDFPYIFDETKAEIFFKWAGFFKHRKGILAGQKIELDIIHKFIAGNIFGWLHRETGYRRFTKMYWQVARKNTKSQFLSLIGTFMLFFSRDTAEVYCAATKKKQAQIVYGEAVAMLQSCDLKEIKRAYIVAYNTIKTKKSGSTMEALSKEDRKSGDGLNPQCGIIDEYHAHETPEILDIIQSGMGARPDPLLAIITTAGFDLNNPCYRVEYDLVSRILNPDNPSNLESYFCMVNELDRNETTDIVIVDGKEIAPGELLDNINDPACWIKANPIVCSYKEGVSSLQKDYDEAIEAPEKMKNFLTKRMNVWVNQRNIGYMDMTKWANCAVTFRNPDKKLYQLIAENTKKRAYVGLDLSAKIDLTSCAFEFPDGNGKYYALSHSFMPRESFAARLNSDKVPYDLWERQGWLTVTEGAVVDYRAVIDYVLRLEKKHDWYIEEVCVDPWGAQQITATLDELGKTVVEIIQGYKTLSEPTKHLRESAYSGSLTHDNSPVLMFAVGNAIIRQDYNQNMTLDKSKAKLRIDPIAALINAHVRAMTSETSGSVYEKRGMRSLND